jgi:hypothetical protein
MCGLERAVDYNTSPVIEREFDRLGLSEVCDPDSAVGDAR